MMIDVVFDCSLYELKSTDKFEAIKELTENTESFRFLPHIKEFEENVISREKNMSTGLGKGVAVAHGYYPDSDKMIIALGISHKGIDYDAIDHEPVHILFLVANPPHYEKEYLKILSTIVGKLRHETFRKALLKYKDPKLLNALLKRSLAFSN